MKGEVGQLIKEAKQEEKYFQNYLKYAKEIKKEAEKFLGKGKVKLMVFDSILRKNEVAQDIDILIISPKLKHYKIRSFLLSKLFKKLGSFSPFQFHLVTPEEYRNWYQRFIKKEFIEI